MLAKWKRTIDRRNKVSDLFSLATAQLNFLGADLKTSYYLPNHVREALHLQDEYH